MMMVLYNDADHHYHHMSLSLMIKTVCIDNDYKHIKCYTISGTVCYSR